MLNQTIDIKGAKLHNLKDVSVSIPKNKLVVFTGVSGSGKSSLCIDTLFAEGQRRYVESLSSYARQFLMRMNKPEVESIKGICPAIAIEQKVSTRSSRSTVGTLTEIYDFLRLLFARVGTTYSPVSNEAVQKHEVVDVVNYFKTLADGTKTMVLYPVRSERDLQSELSILQSKGFVRVLIDDQVFKIEKAIEADIKKCESFFVLVDRLVVKAEDEELLVRLADSVQMAFDESQGDCVLAIVDGEHKAFSNRFELDGMQFEIPNPNLFNFNNPYGACDTCEGFGTVMGIDEDLIFPDHELSVYDGAVAPWRGEKMRKWADALCKKGIHFDFPIHRSYRFLTDEEKQLIWDGNKHFEGLTSFFKMLEENSYKIQYRVMLARYRGRQTCPDCKGSRIRKDAHYVKIDGKSIGQLLQLPINELVPFFEQMQLNDTERTIAKRILVELENRLSVMMEVGLGYLTLNRLSSTLSGGETQRINLTRSLGSNLTESMYILDEPSVGLHPKDTDRLIKVLKKLRDLGNTVIVVEHDEAIIAAADHVVDMGPHAGVFGGEVVFSGASDTLLDAKDSLTALYMTGQLEIEVPEQVRQGINWIKLTGARQHNLQNVDIELPLNALTVVTGPSGSGKTTLIKSILYPALKRMVEDASLKPGPHEKVEGDIKQISQIELIDQNPIGRSSRSNPVTYTKAYDSIRELFAGQQLAKIRGLKTKAFSFNVEGGRCEACKGEGEQLVEMQFLADVRLECESCQGRRFKEEVLEVTYNELSIHEVLELSIDEAIAFFAEQKSIVDRLKPLQDVGLGYIKLGQSSSTLSGGEAQRVKLASFLGKGQSKSPILFIFDEPTTGLHFHDVQKLLTAFNALIGIGHTVLVIEHNADVMKCADWLIDLGPEGGKQGGQLMYQGAPKGIVDVDASSTSAYLKEKFETAKA